MDRYILEVAFEVMLMDAKRVAHIPGRKTDTIDAASLALSLSRGLLEPELRLAAALA